MIAWETTDGSGAGISAKLYNRNGGVQKSEFRVNETTAGAQVDPAVAMASEPWFCSDLEFLRSETTSLTPIQMNYTNDDFGVYARMFNDDGSDYVDDRVSRVGLASSASMRRSKEIRRIGRCDGCRWVLCSDLDRSEPT